jgi:hypothetical protein
MESSENSRHPNVYVEKEMSEEKRLRRIIIVGRSSFDIFRTPIGRDWSSQADATIPLALEVSRLLNVPLIIDRELQEELLQLSRRGGPWPRSCA